MATSSRLFTRQAQRMYYCIQRQYSNKSSSYAFTSRAVSPVTASICGIGVVAATGYWLYNEKKSLLLAPTVQAMEIPRKTEDLSLYPISDKEYRFQSFSSCEYNGQVYMTPQDFLESVTEGNPRHSGSQGARIGRFKLTDAQVQNMLKNTPSRKKSTKNLFRSIMDKGIVSYTEYLFLLCILTKPRAGYEIAFKMFDRDGNHRIDRKEFLLMEEIFRKKSQSSGESGSVSWLSQYATDPDSVCILSHQSKFSQKLSLYKLKFYFALTENWHKISLYKA
eukprot:XP_011672436.1 PREDICTED: calcium uptake protein 3, mitochondrial isoform X2 [Strongylocentrotus purpuratus]